VNVFYLQINFVLQSTFQSYPNRTVFIRSYCENRNGLFSAPSELEGVTWADVVNACSYSRRACVNTSHQMMAALSAVAMSVDECRSSGCVSFTPTYKRQTHYTTNCLLTAN